jgi:hypothetical protein
VTGKWGDIDGVWIDPVTAQEMMILRDAMTFSPMMVVSAMAPKRNREIPVRRGAVAVRLQSEMAFRRIAISLCLSI